jgi:cysteinyl-tRNA synthetase
MSTKYLGDTIDIHGGGADLIFPHHENEIAQAEACTGQPFVNYWMHNGFITINSEKMSKSLGNFFILRDILAKFPRDVVRFYLIATHYRSPLDFDDGKLEEARRALGRLKTTLTLADEFINPDVDGSVPTFGEAADFLKTVEGLRARFIEAMDDDFNTAMAMGFLFEMSHAINSQVAQADRRDPRAQAVIRRALSIFRELGTVLGIFMTSREEDAQAADGLIEILLEMRQKARQEKDYPLADSIRDILNNLNIKVEDKVEASRFRYEKAPSLDQLMHHFIELRQAFKKNKQYPRADLLRDRLKEHNIILEDTREGVRWKFADV